MEDKTGKNMRFNPDQDRHRLKRRIFTTLLLYFFSLTSLIPAAEADDFKIEHVTLKIEIIPGRHWLKGEATFKIQAEIQGWNSLDFYLRPTLRVYDAKDEKNQHLYFSQIPVKRIFPNSDTSLVRVRLKQDLSKQDTAEITISYAGQFFMSSNFDPEARRYNRAFSSITEEAAWLRSVQLWYPYLADKSMPVTIQTTVPSGWTVITNGELAQVNQNQDKQVFVFHDEKAASLDLTLFAAPYISASHKVNGFNLTAYLFPQHEDLIDAYLEKSGEILGFYSQKFGQPNASHFSIIEIGMGYGTGTSAPFGYAVSSHLINLDFPLIPHEIAHLWWGETVSDNLGKDTWLHEGLATFSDTCYRLSKASDEKTRRQILFALLNRAIPIGNPRTPSILEGGEQHAPEGFLVYERAAYVLHTLKHILGDEVFDRSIKTYLNTFRKKKADTDSFIRIIHQVSQEDLSWFFDFFLRGHRPPRYRIDFRNIHYRAEGTLYQDHVPGKFSMPLTLEFITNQRSFRKDIIIKGKKRKFYYNLGTGEEVVRINIDPDFEVLAVRPILEDRWQARALRLEAANTKNFRRVKPQLFSLWERHPENVYLLHEVAQFFFAQQDWEKGIDLYKKILNLKPRDFSFIALANIAGAYETMGNQEMQRLYLEQALAKGSSMYSIMRSLMDKLDRLGKE